MKKLIVCLASAAAVAGILLWTQSVSVTRAEEIAVDDSIRQVGLIDMAYVFKEYAKFKTLSEGLKAEVEQSDAEAKAKVQELQQRQAQLTSGTLIEGSPEYSNLEQSLVTDAAKLETFRKMKQRDFLRKEADIYKTVYLEVQQVVQLYAKEFHYTIIMRFNRDKIENASNPQEIIQGMNRPVVYYDGRDDISQPILDYLNKTYAARATTRPAGASAPTGTRPAGASVPATTPAGAPRRP